MNPSSKALKLLSLLVVLSFLMAAMPVQVASAATRTITVKTNADASVNASSPSTNYGAKTSMPVDASPVVNAYVRFNVSGLNGARIVKANLRVHTLSSSRTGLSVSKAGSSWSESSINFDNAPGIGDFVTRNKAFLSRIWTNLDVTSAVTGEGDFTFAITNPSNAAFSLATKERGSSYIAKLVLTLDTSGSPAPEPTPPSSPSGGPMPLGVPGAWNLKFSDDFNGGSLDLNKWEPNWLAGSDTAITKPINGSELSCYDPRQVSVADGKLKLSAVARSCTANNGKTYKYASGIVTSRPHYTFSYGFMEARVWLDGSSTIKNWPAFWADGTGQWPTTGEIDVFEGLGGKASWHYHYGTPDNHQSKGGYPSMSTQTGWHTFGAEWTSSAIKYYYDGKLVGSVTSGVVKGPMFLILNYGVSTEISPPVQVASNFQVDYVRVWQK